MLQHVQYKGRLSFVNSSDHSQAVTLPSVRIKVTDLNYCSQKGCLGERVSWRCTVHFL